jgi:hypothetical protein
MLLPAKKSFKKNATRQFDSHQSVQVRIKRVACIAALSNPERSLYGETF